MEPMAVTVAGPEPEIAAKNMQPMMVAIPSPPVNFPTAASAMLTIRRAIPPKAIRFPASIKKGMAISVKESRPVKAF
ncbi:hypothetical protein SDC9_106570 [bioreactor metagenome]|uniref:Uncharacterized protein n=1 Tax=bioreactor metagenome TaxID=1076179 RepID=A0A645BDE5_9ZZZZ